MTRIPRDRYGFPHTGVSFKPDARGRGWGFAPGASLRTYDGAPIDRPAPRKSQPRGSAARIGYWLGGLRRIPDVPEIMSRWGVTRATAYRWRAFAESGGSTAPHAFNPRKSQ